jgi:hypothetical protein
MIVCIQQNLTYPLSDDLYWVPGGRDSGPLYSASNFYFASADGSRLVPALSDKQRFITALTTEIAAIAGFSCVPGLQAILDALTESNTPPVPRYPQVGDVDILGVVLGAGKLVTLPDGVSVPSGLNPFCGGAVQVLIQQDGFVYDTPPAHFVETGSDEIGHWRLGAEAGFQMCRGQLVRFDIFAGLFSAGARNVTAV